ncbi:MAG: Guanylate kinase [Betaproteobacteria bacterium ADurb.Bin341]|nr:MAG: Guanylate kinase [Betaproteobacteria bacterium ADurb.Bin341]
MKGTLYVIAAPSGAGKTTLVRLLLQQDLRLHLSISFTTRPPRPGEEHGREYHFVPADEFRAMNERGDFLEWAEVHGHFYGTSRAWIETQINGGNDVLLEIDWQGARQVRTLFPNAVSVFILPPEADALSARLTSRGTDSEEVIARRLASAKEEMRHVEEFDYVIINDALDEALGDLCAIVRASRLRLECQRRRYPALFSQFVSIT